ncbi:histidine kinase [Paraburkholderia phosphatilytica]|uniref:PAS domain-containing sensor histidine kinase n=1 Tax=Paraburkholderia phosphatilytica TaxID=2282883 RepID=UPI000E4F8250|nr:histidine kinase [Paraburkholderia phosphatilytica]
MRNARSGHARRNDDTYQHMAATSSARSRSRKILFVGAGAGQSVSTVELLQQLGLGIRHAPDRASALQHAHAARPDLVMIDATDIGLDCDGVRRDFEADAKLAGVPVLLVAHPAAIDPDASERQWRTLAENLPVSIIRYDLACRPTYLSAAYEQLAANTAADSAGTAPLVRPALSAADSTRLAANVREVLASGASAEFELSPETDGGANWIAVRIVPEFCPAGHVVSALVIGQDISAHRQMEQALRALANRRESDLEEERHRIARELHDELGQQLVGLRMNVNMLHMLSGKNEVRMHEVADTMLTLVDTLIQSTRDVSASLRPTILDMGLIPALEWLTSRFTRHTGIRCQLKVDQIEAEMTAEQAVAIFRIAQESLTNAATHSKATRINVTFRREPDALVIEIKDNGTGFDVQNVRKPNAFGLVGMRERALAAGGEAVITSTPRRGTVVRARIPVAPGDRGSA